MSVIQAETGTSQSVGTVQGSVCTTNLLANGLLNKGAKEAFTNNLEEICKFWVNLLIETTLPPDISHTDPRIDAVIQRLEGVIAGTGWAKARLGSVLLSRLLQSLQERIRRLRQEGAYFTKRKCSSIVIDRYASAQNLPLEKRLGHVLSIALG